MMRRSILTSFFIFITFASFSQEHGGIMGQITDAEMHDEPMLFANVKLKDTDKSVQTNFHGNFEISEIKAGNYTLIISYPGYETREVPVEVQANNIIDIQENMVARTIDINAVLSSETSPVLSDAGVMAQPEK